MAQAPDECGYRYKPGQIEYLVSTVNSIYEVVAGTIHDPSAGLVGRLQAVERNIDSIRDDVAVLRANAKRLEQLEQTIQVSVVQPQEARRAAFARSAWLVVGAVITTLTGSTLGALLLSMAKR